MKKNLINYGQHFLTNYEYFYTLISSADINKSDIVLEIGAGDGRLTKILSKFANKVISFEVDKRNKEYLLKEKLKNVNFIFENYLENKDNLIFNKIVSSLPYQITEPFIEKIINLDFDCATLIVGKRFAQACKNNNIIKSALITNCFFYVDVITEISPENFDPPPKVYSSIIKLTKRGKESLDSYHYILRELFEQRDKKIKNALKEAIIRLYSLKNIVLTQKQSKELIIKFFKELPEEEYLYNCSNEDYIKLGKNLNQFSKFFKKLVNVF